MRVLVAGATGFIGQVLCTRLLRDGYDVRALVRSASRTRGLAVGELELHEGDVLDAATLQGAGAGARQAPAPEAAGAVHHAVAAERAARERPPAPVAP